MATITKRRSTTGATRWTAQVRRGGRTLASRTFPLRGDAERWAREVERAADTATPDRPFEPAAWAVRAVAPIEPVPLEAPPPPDDDHLPAPSTRWTVRRALEHYRDTATADKKGASKERNRIKHLCDEPWSSKTLEDFSAEDLVEYVQKRKSLGKAASSIHNEVGRISIMFRTAAAPKTKGGWGLPLDNPAPRVSLPRLPGGRQRRLYDGEEGVVRRALSSGLNGYEMALIFRIALDTGMRRSEIIDLRVGEIRTAGKIPVIQRGDSKNGHPRLITLTKNAYEGIKLQITWHLGDNPDKKDKVFSLNAEAVATRWDIARKEKFDDLRFHDIRHEALSRMAEAGMNLKELMAQSGHRTAAMVARYLEARPERISRALEFADLRRRREAEEADRERERAHRKA